VVDSHSSASRVQIAKTPPERGFDIKKVKLTDKPRSFGIASWTVIHPFSAIRIAKTPPERGFCVKGETDR
ncbi:hypothetical protein KFB16_26245, partial [Klebsiella pneumoniae]|uniref:hypothetical protein n=1 Tax=Klebsiella pneumoniae TaxID=573 RepID=UPI001CC15EFA